MNRRRRDLLKVAIGCLDQAVGIIERVYDEENDCLENIPENLQGSSRYEKIEEVIQILDEAMDCSTDATNKLMEAIIA